MCFKNNRKKLRKLFKHYAKRDAKGEDLSVTEFLDLTKDCEFQRNGMSFAKCLTCYIMSNTEELEHFLHGRMTSSGMIKYLQMDYNEFELTLAYLAEHSQKKDSQPKDLGKATSQMLSTIFNACPHVHLNLFQMD